MNDSPRLLVAGRISLLIALLVIMGYPLLWVVLASLKTNAELVANPFGLPQQPQIENIRYVWVDGNFLRYFRNSLIISLSTVTGVVIMATMAGYVFARRRTRIAGLLFGLFLIGLMIPRDIMLIPVFRIVADLGLRNSLLGIILVYLAGTSFGIFVMRTYFLTIPSELGEAALIDGCSEFGMFRRIYVPLAGPAVVTIAIFTFFYSWNDFLWPLILIQDSEWFTIQQGLLSFQDRFTIDWALRNAGLIFSILPPLIFYIIFNRGIQKGLTAGAVKL